MSADLSTFDLTGNNNPRKQVSVTYQNAMLRAIESAIDAVEVESGGGDMLSTNNLSDLANAATARTNLGLAIGTNVQAYDADLTTYASITPSANVQTLLGAASFAAFNTSLGLGTGSSPQFTAIEIGAASDTTLARSSAGNLSVEGNLIYRAGGTDVPLTDGGTGASDAATARTNLGITSTNVKLTESIIIACSDESTAITTGTAKVTFRMPYAFTLTDVRASVNTAPTGSTILIDINEAGTTILSTKLMIDASEKTSTTAATPAVISDSSLADDAEITVDFDQVGSTIAGKGVKVILIGART